MPLLAADVREPKGHVSTALFPADDAAALDARLTAYLAEAYARPAVAALAAGTQQDEAAAAWVYARAFRAAYNERIASALQKSVDGSGSSAYSDAQLDKIADEADRWLRVYDERTADTGVATGHGVPATRSHSINFRW